MTPPTDLRRLPSGAVTAAALPFRQSVWNAIVPDEAGYILGTKLRQAFTLEKLGDCQIVCWEFLDARIGESLHRSVAAGALPTVLRHESLDFRYGEYSPFRRHQPVILLLDFILSGRTAKRLVRVLRRMEAAPMVVACIVDGRQDSGGPLTGFGHPLRVVSCVATPLVEAERRGANAAPANGAIADVDLGSTMPNTENSPVDVTAPFVSALLRTRATGGIHIGHVDRGRQRHFSTYLSVGELIADSLEGIDAATDSAIKAFALEPNDTRKLRIIHPTKDGGFAATLAKAVAERFVVRGILPAAAAVVSAHRQTGSSWSLTSGPWDDDWLSLVVDWGAVTTNTVRHLLDLSAQNRATQVHAAILTSQLDADAERSLTSIAQIHAVLLPIPSSELIFDAGAVRASEHANVPISVEFLSRVRLGMAPSNDCELCRLTDQFKRDAVEAPSKMLRSHALKKFEVYRPRSREEILRSTTTDLVGTPLSPEEASSVWDKHFRLELAAASTFHTSQLRDAILSLPDMGESESAAWLRLLTVEPSWMSRLPLDDDDIRSVLGLQCVSFLERGKVVDSPQISWQAAIVLRVVSKTLFLENFSSIVTASVSDGLVAAELCYGMLTLLRRPYNHERYIMNKVLSALHDTRDQLADLRNPEPTARELQYTVSSLYRMAIEIQTRVNGRTDALSSWHGLQNSYSAAVNTHALALTSILTVVDAFSGLAGQRRARSSHKSDAAYWSVISVAWSECWDFLASSVFPFLPNLQALLEPRRGTGEIHIMTFTSDRAARFADDLARLEQDPSRFSEDLRQRLELESLEWFNALLRAPEGVHNARIDGPYLLWMLTQNPCNLSAALERARILAEGRGLVLCDFEVDANANSLVFCRMPLLIELFVQVIENATAMKHAAPGRPSEGARIRVDVSSFGEFVNVRVLNDWTVVDSGGSGGLFALADELEAFGGTFPAHGAVGADTRDAEEGWTYAVTVQLRKWTPL